MNNKFKIVFISNYFNHHQKYLSDELFKATYGNYHFIETEEISEERLNLGYTGFKDEGYVKNSYSSMNASDECRGIIDCADIAIAGSAPESLLLNRKKNGNLIFRYSERILKNGLEPIKYPIRFLHLKKNNFADSNTYLLCASAYTAADYAKFGLFKNKAYKWGYFPETRKYESIENVIGSKKKKSLLWAGRFLDWKHPDAAIRIAKRLKEEGYDFELNIIGTGAMEQKLKNMVSDYKLENEVHMLGSMKPVQVREYMEQSQIYLFTSDRNEGWGAVLNESMNSACAVVASHAIGSVPFLLKSGENGLIYKDGDEEDLYKKVKLLLDKPDLCRQYATNAYLTIINEWNAETAAKRFIELAGTILSGNKNPDLFPSGPCSMAERLSDNWYDCRD